MLMNNYYYPIPVHVVQKLNGQCDNQEGTLNFSCTCDPGFTGELCQTNIDDCVGGEL